MPKVYCADVTCEYVNENGVCTAKVISLSWHSVATVYDGVQEFNRCKAFQKSSRVKELEKKIGDLLKKG